MSAPSKKSRKFHYGYLIVLSFVMTSFGPLSFGLSCMGLFFTPVASELGASAGVASYYASAINIASLLTLALEGRLIAKVDVRICTSVAVALMGVAFFLESRVTEMWQYLACGVLMGIGITMLLFVAPSTLINRWFKERSGFFLGICMAFTGVGGMIWNVVGGMLIAELGWRTALMVFGVLVLVLGLPFTLFVLRNDPRSVGTVPFGSDTDDEEAPSEEQTVPGIEANLVAKRRSFWPLLGFAFLLNFGMYVYQMIPSYSATLPLSIDFPMLGATAAAVAMASQTISKVVLGWAGEKDTLISIVTAIALGIIGVLILAFGAVSVPAVYAGVALFGVYYALTNVMLPILTRKFYGVREYSVIYSRVSLAACLGGTLASFAWGTLISVTGSFLPMLLGVVGVLAVAAYASVVAITIVRKHLPSVLEDQGLPPDYPVSYLGSSHHNTVACGEEGVKTDTK